MNPPKLTTRRPSLAELRLPDLGNPTEADLERLARQADVVRLPRGLRVTQPEGRQTHLWFLLRGRLQVRDAHGEREIGGGTPQARSPLFPVGACGACLCLTEIELLRIPLAPPRDPGQAPGPEEDTGGRLEARIDGDLRQALQAGTLELPAMPTVAVRIARHLDAQDASAESIARLLHMDPSLTARLIQVANSPAFGARGRVDTCRDAILRLGHQTIRDLVTSFVLKGVFRARGDLLKARMRELWQHSTQVAALSHALARRLPGFDPAQALLIGLVHDIGVIPLLTAAPRYPGLAEDRALLERVIQRLRAPFSATLLGAWGFPGEFTVAALEAEDWFRDPTPRADYVDLLLIAQLHAHVGTPRMAQLPRIDQIPAFHKLTLGQLSPRLSLALLDEANRDIEQVRQMIA